IHNLLRRAGPDRKAAVGTDHDVVTQVPVGGNVGVLPPALGGPHDESPGFTAFDELRILRQTTGRDIDVAAQQSRPSFRRSVEGYVRELRPGRLVQHLQVNVVSSPEERTTPSERARVGQRVLQQLLKGLKGAV